MTDYSMFILFQIIPTLPHSVLLNTRHKLHPYIISKLYFLQHDKILFLSSTAEEIVLYKCSSMESLLLTFSDRSALPRHHMTVNQEDDVRNGERESLQTPNSLSLIFLIKLTHSTQNMIRLDFRQSLPLTSITKQTTSTQSTPPRIRSDITTYFVCLYFKI